MENYENWINSDLSFLPKYPFSREEDVIIFHTDKNITYEVYFTEGESYLPGLPFSADIKMFGFRNLTPLPEKESFDSLVHTTIIYCVLEYFKDSRAILLYACDTSDKRERYRKRLFDLWFKDYSNKLYKNDQQFGDNLFLSIITRMDNPHVEELKDTFVDIGKGLK